MVSAAWAGQSRSGGGGPGSVGALRPGVVAFAMGAKTTCAPVAPRASPGPRGRAPVRCRAATGQRAPWCAARAPARSARGTLGRRRARGVDRHQLLVAGRPDQPHLEERAVDDTGGHDLTARGARRGRVVRALGVGEVLLVGA